jgi:hypothetical protein
MYALPPSSGSKTQTSKKRATGRSQSQLTSVFDSKCGTYGLFRNVGSYERPQLEAVTRRRLNIANSVCVTVICKLQCRLVCQSVQYIQLSIRTQSAVTIHACLGLNGIYLIHSAISLLIRTDNIETSLCCA